MAFFIWVYVGVEVTIGGWIVTFVIEERGGGPSAGYVSSGFFAGLMLGRVILLWVNEKIGERRVVYLYCILCIALELVIWLVPNLIGNAVAVSIVGLLLVSNMSQKLALYRTRISHCNEHHRRDCAQTYPDWEHRLDCIFWSSRFCCVPLHDRCLGAKAWCQSVAASVGWNDLIAARAVDIDSCQPKAPRRLKAPALRSSQVKESCTEHDRKEAQVLSSFVPSGDTH
ncbi:hypothetical protein RSAG8_01888, partial [Rhizoctonia solani AG-8 WAC10335]